jgi:hypothetical protein
VVQAVRLAALGLLFACGAAAAQNVPTCSLTAAPTSGTGATDVTLTWSTQHATTCVASGAWSGPKDCAGGTQVRNDVMGTSTFTLKVTASTGKVVARWDKITQNQDGSPAVVTGYKLFIADAPTGLPSATAIALPANPQDYTFWRSPGPVSAGIKSVRSDSVESVLSNVASKTVVAASGTCAATVTIAPRPKAPSLTLTLSKLKEFFTGEKADET